MTNTRRIRNIGLPLAVVAVGLMGMAGAVQPAQAHLATPVAAHAPAAVGKVKLKDLPDYVPYTIERVKSNQRLCESDGTEYKDTAGVLPKQAAGYYHQWVVPQPVGFRAAEKCEVDDGGPGGSVAPSAYDPGPERLVIGGNAQDPDHWYYSPDQFKTFKEIVDVPKG